MEPSTNLCPLLPGQMVNVLDVPVQGEVLFGGRRKVSSNYLDSAVFTLDPKDKYLPPGVRRAITTSAVHSRKACLPTTTRPMIRALRMGSAGAEVAPQASESIQALFTLERQHSLLSVFHRMRQTRSAGSSTNSSLVRPRKIFSRAGQPTKQDAGDPLPEMAKLHNCAPSLPPTRIGDGFAMSIELPFTANNTDRAPTTLMANLTGLKNNVRPLDQLPSSHQSQSALPNEREQGLEDGHLTSSFRNSETSFLLSYYTPPEQLSDALSYFTPTPADERNDMALSNHLGRLNLAPDAEETLIDPTKRPLDKQTTIPNAVPSTETLGSCELDFDSPKYGYADSLASYATSANFSPCLASNTTHSGPMSPCPLPQPVTPIMSDCEDEFLPPLRDSESLTQIGRSTSSDLGHLLARPFSRATPPRPQGGDTQNSHTTSGGFQVYSLPDHDHASVLTIRKLPSITIKKADGASPFPQKGSKQDLVHSWNDGSQDRMTSLGELVDDLGYLGEVII